ncbi:MAG: class I SAM-dependent methyltransferase [Acidimicrobiales bacterium]
MAGDAERRWAEQLAAWEIPEEIRSKAVADPWKLTPSVFPAPAADEPPADTPTRRVALAALGDGGTILDVGAGTGGASLHLVPPATEVSAVDEGEDMLEAFSARARDLGVPHQVYPGRWPDVAGAVPVADLVASNHVLYNVPDLAGFVVALTSHARRRVVVQITGRHPVTGSNPLWKHFWDLDRPEGPTADDAIAVLEEVGIRPQVEREVRPGWRAMDRSDRVVFLTRRLCLPPERQPEVEEALAKMPEPTQREIVTLWWDGAAP